MGDIAGAVGTQWVLELVILGILSTSRLWSVQVWSWLILKGNRPKAEVTAGGAAGDVGTQWGWKLLRVLRRG